MNTFKISKKHEIVFYYPKTDESPFPEEGVVHDIEI